MLMLNWIIWNWTVFDIETVLTLNWIVIYEALYFDVAQGRLNGAPNETLNWIAASK